MSEIYDVTVPLMGEGVNEVTIVKWLYTKGDLIEKDSALLEVSTDKVDTEIMAEHSGYLIETWAKVDETVNVDNIIASISDDKKAIAPKPVNKAKKISAKEASKTTTQQRSSATTSTKNDFASAPINMDVVNHGKIKSSPLVRKLAQKNNVDLAYVKGTGLANRITRADIEAYIHAMSTQNINLFQSGAQQNKPTAHLEYGKLTTEVKDGQEYLDNVQVKREPMDKMRKLIAEHMSRSVRTSPHVSMSFAMDLTNVLQIRKNIQQQYTSTHGHKLTLTPFFIKAAIEAIKQHPIINTSVDAEDILYKKDINIGCAVAIPDGLLVPVIKKSNLMNLTEIATTLNDLALRARSKKLLAEDLQGGTFSLTNPGIFGCLHSMPIINQPQVAILAINTISKQLSLLRGEVVEKSIIQIGLTFDHRVIDGEGGARFLATYKEILENFDFPL